MSRTLWARYTRESTGEVELYTCGEAGTCDRCETETALIGFDSSAQEYRPLLFCKPCLLIIITEV